MRIVFGLLVGFSLSLFFLALSVISSGAGHDDYFYAKLFFPFSLFLWQRLGSSLWLPICICLILYPLYGLLVVSVKGTVKRLVVILFIIGFHFGFFYLYPNQTLCC